MFMAVIIFVYLVIDGYRRTNVWMSCYVYMQCMDVWMCTGCSGRIWLCLVMVNYMSSKPVIIGQVFSGRGYKDDDCVI